MAIPEPSSNPFHVGDMVIGNEGAKRYGVTTQGFIAEVKHIKNDSEIFIVGTDEKHSGDVVEARCFDLYVSSGKNKKEGAVSMKTQARYSSHVVSLTSLAFVEKQFKEDMIKLRGEPVLLKRNSSNEYVGRVYKGILVDIQIDAAHPIDITKARFVIHLEAQSDTYTASWLQFEIDRDLPVDKKAIYTILAQTIEKERTKEIANAKSSVSQRVAELEDLKRRIIQGDEDLKNAEKSLKEIEKSHRSYSASDFTKEVALIKKHTMVEDVYISDQNNLIVLTKDLVAVNSETGKPRPEHIGRFIMRFTLGSNSVIQISNRDWLCDNNYWHPNIPTDGQVCWGNGQTVVRTMLKKGEFYMLVDFIITFLSLFPHDGGRPHKSHMDWLNQKVHHESSDFLEAKL